MESALTTANPAQKQIVLPTLLAHIRWQIWKMTDACSAEFWPGRSARRPKDIKKVTGWPIYSGRRAASLQLPVPTTSPPWCAGRLALLFTQVLANVYVGRLSFFGCI
eukprot:5986289-Amphidinium_carterae.1